MINEIGFSYVGLFYLLLLFIPNSIWTKKKPEGYDPSGENKILLLLERTGQVLVTACALMFDSLNLRPFTQWSLWLAASFGLMAVYEFFWIRYFKNPTLTNFYRPFLGIPVPGATLPVAAFLLLGIYGRVVWLIIAVVILGVGHIGIHIQHVKRLGIGRRKD